MRTAVILKTLLFPLPLPTSRLKTHLEENLNPNFETPLNSLGSEKVSRHMLIFCKLYTSKGKIPFLAFSLIMFAYAGSASFPTYQTDMKNKADFPKAVLFAMISEKKY